MAPFNCNLAKRARPAQKQWGRAPGRTVRTACVWGVAGAGAAAEEGVTGRNTHGGTGVRRCAAAFCGSGGVGVYCGAATARPWPGP